MAINVQNLTKQYDTQRAIDALNFVVKPGEILGFLGPNGAGKTTTLKIIAGYMLPTEGTVSLHGWNIHEDSVEMRKRIGYLPEHNPLYLDMFVQEFLNYTARIYQLPSSQRKERIAEVIAQTGLEREQHKKIRMLSKGYRQRVGLAQALIHDPEVLILDEPTTGLDPNQIVDIRTLIQSVGRDKTVIFSSHILSEVEAIADRVLIINQGKIVADQQTDALKTLTEDQVMVFATFETPGFDLSSLVQTTGIKEWEWLNDTQIQIRTNQDVDIRKPLFEACVAQNHVLLELRRESYSLEEVFRTLTQAAPSTE